KMATVFDDQVRWVRQFVEGPPAQLDQPEAASSTWKAGDLVFMQNGFLTLCASPNPTQIYGVTIRVGQNVAAGVARSPSYLVQESSVFEIGVKSNLNNYVLLASDIGCAMSIQRDSATGIWYCDASAARGGANVRVFTHQTARGSNIGDTNARVQVT